MTEGSRGRRAATRSVVAVVVLACVAAGAVYVLNRESVAPPAQSAEAVHQAETTVGEDGFTLALEGVTVVGPRDVAPLGTTVSAAVTEVRVPDAFARMASVAAPGVEISFAGGLQPEEPLTITFHDVPDTVNAVLAEADTETGAEFADATRSGGDVRVVADHLSWFSPVTVAAEAFMETLAKEVEAAMAVSVPEPSCHGESVQVEGADWVFTGPTDQILWPCATSNSSGTTVSLTGNTSMGWIVTGPESATPKMATIEDFLTADAVVAVVALQMIDRGTQSVLLAGGSANYRLAEPATETAFVVELNPPLTVVRSVVKAIEPFVPVKWLEKFAKAQCLVDVVTAGGSPGKMVSAVLSCVGTVVGGLLGAILGAVAAVPGALVAVVEGALRSATNKDSYEVVFGPDPAPAVAGDMEQFIGTWSGPIHQPSSNTPYTVVMELWADDGSLLGKVAYPELDNCSGHLSDAEVSGATLRMTENITEGNRCTPTVSLTLVRDGESLLYDASDGVATGTLTRGAGGGGSGSGAESGGWPTDRDDGFPALYVWLGANLMDMPTWVACDADRDFCLLGGSSEHVVISADDLEVLGTVSGAAGDVSAQLTGLGVPSASVAEILGS